VLPFCYLFLTLLIGPRVYSSPYMSIVHLQQSAVVNAVSLRPHRGLHTHASPSNLSRPSVASRSRQKRTFFGIGEILQVVVNVRMFLDLPRSRGSRLVDPPS